MAGEVITISHWRVFISARCSFSSCSSGGNFFTAWSVRQSRYQPASLSSKGSMCSPDLGNHVGLPLQEKKECAGGELTSIWWGLIPQERGGRFRGPCGRRCADI